MRDPLRRILNRQAILLSLVMVSIQVLLAFPGAEPVSVEVSAYSMGLPEAVASGYEADPAVQSVTRIAPKYTWARVLYEPSREFLDSVTDTLDGGHISAGSVFGQDGSVGLVVKLDRRGHIEWQKTYDFLGYGSFTKILKGPDGYFLSGRSPQGTTLTKIDRDGNHLWSFVPSNGISDFDVVAGGLLFVGGGGVTKLSDAGEIVWQRSYGDHPLTAISVGSDGGIIVGGAAGDSSPGHALLVKLSSQGGIEWQSTYYFGNSSSLHYVAPSADGYVVWGSRYQYGYYGPYFEPWVFKVSSSGQVVWHLNYQTPTIPGIFDVKALESGETVLVGGYNLNGAQTYIVVIDKNGNIEWQKRFDIGGQSNHATSVVEADDSLVVVGDVTYPGSPSDPNPYTMRIGKDGSLINCSLGQDYLVPLFRSQIDLGPGQAQATTTSVTLNPIAVAVQDSSLTPNTICEGGTPQELMIAHIEITQGIQDVDNHVPLIAHKPTIARVYIDCGEGCTELPNITGSLEVSSLSGRISLMPTNGTVAARDIGYWTEQREEGMAETLNFSIPTHLLAGDVTFEASVENGNYSVTRRFHAVNDLRVGFVVLSNNGSEPEQDRVRQAYAYVQHLFPVSNVDYFPVLPLDGPACDEVNDAEAGNSSAVIGCLEAIDMWYEASGWPAPNGRPDFLFGWVPYSTWGVDGGARLNTRLAYGSDVPYNSTYKVILGHELSHNLGRLHPFEENGTNPPPDNQCDLRDENWPYDDNLDEEYDYSIHNVGYDFGVYPRRNPLVRSDTDDLMIGRHCGASATADKWLSAYTFGGLFDILVNREGLLRQELATDPEERPILLVSGTVFSDFTAELDEAYHVVSSREVESDPESDFCLSLEDASGMTISSDCFNLIFENPEWNTPQSQARFNRVLKYDESAARLVLSKGSNILAERIVSAHAPQVTLLSLGAMQRVGSSADVVWDASDPDGDDLYAAIAYSADGGQSWHVLATGVKNQRYTVDMSSLPGSEQALFRVLVTDGIRTAQDSQDNSIIVPSHTPQVSISSPSLTSAFPIGQPIVFLGHAYDPEDGLLDAESISWSSSRDGYLGAGRRVVANLSAGEHSITVLATDSDNNESSAARRIFVGGAVYFPTIRR